MNNNVKFGVLASLIVVAASFFASSFPDGLEFIAEKLGFLHKGVSGSAIMKDYSIAILGNGAISTAVAGLIGIVVILSVFALFTKVTTFNNKG